MSAPKILVVDDHREALELLEVVLKLAGFEVTAMADGLSALETTLDDYSAVVTDLAMPQMDGTELVRHLRARMKRPVPIVVLTGQGIPLERLDCRCCVLIRKPALPDHLTSTLQWLIESCTRECESCANGRRQRQTTDPP